jgi:hypothetical protein
MRGGALPLLAWGTLLALLMILNGVWTGDRIQVATFAFACVVVFGGALALIAIGRSKAARRGEPEAPMRPEAVPVVSLSAVGIAVAVASMVFGLAFGHFLIYFGAGLLIVSLGAVAREVRAERRLRRHYEHRGRGGRT